MRLPFLILFVLLFIGCNTIKKLNGRYTNGNNVELKIKDRPKDFEYFLRSEMGVLQYSKGKWTLRERKLYLLGFSDEDIKALDVEHVINKNADGNSTRVEIHYSTDKAITYIKSVIVINDSKIYMIAKDTMLTPDYKVETIQVKSYLSYTGLLSSPQKIDTLYSSKIKVSDESNANKNIVLKFTVHPYDFVRVKLTDTLTVRNSHTLYQNKTKLKEIIE